jgi:hypothetical protein
MNARSILAIVLLSCASVPAWAGVPALPEPGVLELIGIAAVVGAVVAFRKRRK